MALGESNLLTFCFYAWLRTTLFRLLLLLFVSSSSSATPADDTLEPNDDIQSWDVLSGFQSCKFAWWLEATRIVWLRGKFHFPLGYIIKSIKFSNLGFPLDVDIFTFWVNFNQIAVVANFRLPVQKCQNPIKPIGGIIISNSTGANPSSSKANTSFVSANTSRNRVPPNSPQEKGDPLEADVMQSSAVKGIIVHGENWLV